MVRYFAILMFTFLCNSSFAQKTQVKSKTTPKTKSTKATSKKTEIVCNEADKQAQFPDGNEGWIRFLKNNMNTSVPMDNAAPNGLYAVIVGFNVETDGSLSEIKAKTKHGYGMEEEAVRVLKKSPTWYPAYENCKKITFYKEVKISFSVNKD